MFLHFSLILNLIPVIHIIIFLKFPTSITKFSKLNFPKYHEETLTYVLRMSTFIFLIVVPENYC